MTSSAIAAMWAECWTNSAGPPLKAQDIDQEVKERAISCMGQIIAHLGKSFCPV